MKENNKTILIDKYITGKLEDTELWEFKIELERDAKLAREVKLRKEMYSTIGNDQKMELLKTLNNLKVRKQKRVLRINIYSRQLQAIAASLIILMIVGSGLLSNYMGNNYDSNYYLYVENFIDEGSLISTRSDVKADNSLVETGIRMYDNKQYAEAISLLDSNPENVTARLYSGFAYMKLELFENAEKQFKYIIDHKDNIFIDQAEWNLGLSYLANNKADQATLVFTKIASENGAYSTKASAIIKKLKNN
jgi:tetratricopeptide (TPR) repeat protein